jgi:hypothetical protein
MINVTIGESKTQESKPFPKLMCGIESGNIVLFYKPHEGTVVFEGNFNDGNMGLGEFFDAYNMEFFQDFTGSLTLQNA